MYTGTAELYLYLVDGIVHFLIHHEVSGAVNKEMYSLIRYMVSFKLVIIKYCKDTIFQKLEMRFHNLVNGPSGKTYYIRY